MLEIKDKDIHTVLKYSNSYWSNKSKLAKFGEIRTQGQNRKQIQQF